MNIWRESIGLECLWSLIARSSRAPGRRESPLRADRSAFGFPYFVTLSRVAQIRILLSHRFPRHPWRFNPTKRYCVRLGRLLQPA